MFRGCQFGDFHKVKMVDLPRSFFLFLFFLRDMFLSCMRSIRAGNRTVLRVFSFAMKSFWMVITDGHYACNIKTWKKNIIISTLLGGISRETITYSFEVVNTEDAEKLNVHDNRVECLAVLYFNKLSNFLRKTISSFRVYFEIHLLNIIKISEWLVNFQVSFSTWSLT